MKRTLTRLTSVVLAFALLFSAVALGVAGTQIPAEMTGVVPAARGEQVVQADATTLTEALLFSEDACTDHACTAATVNKDGVLTHCGGTGVCPHSPSIIMHGIGQSETYLLDDDGNRVYGPDGRPVSAWPISVDTDALMNKLAWPVLRTLITQKDNGLSDLGAEVAKEIFAANATGPDGQPINNVELVRYPYSVARCTPQEKNFIYSSMRLTNYTEIAGEDHLYYFAYSSFGNNLEIAEELYEYIQQVKRETGHDKVNLVPVSLGGTIANTLLEYYPQVYTDLNRVLYIVPALDGSSIVGDIYTDNLSLSDDMLYNKLAPSLLEGGYLGYVINIAMRLLPKEVLRAVLDKAIDALFESALLNCTVMWSLVPSWAYPEAAAKHLSEPEQAEIKRQTDLYYQAQRNSRANILKLVESGVDVLNIVDYNQMLYAIAGSYDELNADGVIHLDSTSMGATSGYIDTPLPEGYVQQDTYCTHPGQHNHISPDGIVDASTGILPESTWYFRNQHHEGTGRNDVIIKLATELLLTNEITSVHDVPDRYPQFNEGREARGFIGDVEHAKRIDQSKLAPEDAAELQAAIEQSEAMLNNTIVVYEEYVAARDRLFAILIKIGDRQPPKDTRNEEIAGFFCKLISDALYKYWGPRGFSDWGKL